MVHLWYRNREKARIKPDVRSFTNIYERRRLDLDDLLLKKVEKQIAENTELRYFLKNRYLSKTEELLLDYYLDSKLKM